LFSKSPSNGNAQKTSCFKVLLALLSKRFFFSIFLKKYKGKGKKLIINFQIIIFSFSFLVLLKNLKSQLLQEIFIQQLLKKLQMV